MRFYPFFQACKLSCHSFMGSNCSQETPGSGTKYFTAHRTASSMSINIFASFLLLPSPTGEYIMDPDDICTQSGLLQKRSSRPSPGFLKKRWQASLPYPESRQSHDSHVTVTLTYSCLCDQLQKLLSLGRWRSLAQSGMLSKDMQGHSGSWQTCLFRQPTLHVLGRTAIFIWIHSVDHSD